MRKSEKMEVFSQEERRLGQGHKNCLSMFGRMTEWSLTVWGVRDFFKHSVTLWTHTNTHRVSWRQVRVWLRAQLATQTPGSESWLCLGQIA